MAAKKTPLPNYVLSEMRKRFRLMLSSIKAAATAVTKLFFHEYLATNRASNLRIYYCLVSIVYISSANDVIDLLKVDCKSHKRLHFGSFSGLDFLGNGSTDFEEVSNFGKDN